MRRFTIAARPGLVVIRGGLADNATHRHHAIQYTVGLSGAVRVDDGPPRASVLIAADHPHRVSARDALTALLDPETTVARELTDELLEGSPLAVDVPDLRGRIAAESPLAPELDPRIADLLGWLDACFAAGRGDEVTFGAARKRAALSESRLSHLFRLQTGITWRRSLVWRRALTAMRRVSDGRSLTEAAHAAGYADSAHFSRQFRALFGFPPGSVAKNSSYVQVSELLGAHIVP